MQKRDKYESPNPRRAHTLMSQEDVQAGKKSSWYELEITGTVRNLCPELWRLAHLTSLYLNDNNLVRIPPDIARLEHLHYLDLSSNKIRNLPAEIGDLIHLRELLLNYNHLRVLPFELGKLFNLQNLGLIGNPLTQEMLKMYSEGTQKLLTYLLDSLVVNASAPPQRQWIPLSRPEPGRPAAIFTVMCYNVLCDKYCTRQQYGYCPSWGLNWEYRKKGIMDEIRTCAADIISLQEVETDQFFNFFKPELERDGYQGIFSPKSRARTMTEQERKHVDGCAIFFRTSKFSLVKEHLIEFNQLAMANAEGSDQMLNRVMTKDNIGLAALLETREGVFDSSGGLPPEGKIKQPLLVTTAHMHWDPEFSDVKLIQTMMLMSELKKVVEESYLVIRPDFTGQTVDCNSIPMILCGDLNSLPESGVIEYLSTGRVASNHIDFKELGYEACLQVFNSHKETSSHLMHKFRLAKAYEDNIMRHTNYTFDFKGIIDYIFYSRHYMNLLGVLGPMDENWFHENKVVGCPHPHIPSDHFSLFVEFEMPVPYPDISTILNDDTPVTTSSGNSLGAIGSSRDKHHR
ncbi:CCR4-NOT transcription complex subunit 6-like isoform X2 [Mercenaria mercenaria]|uniref:CCR4-NOT transcription complex subunit 6-like isoform X2 n=1 Tax=Mercenaria mercenaria TaxID=6596 RepID=UPI001E1DE768|nr:CCR4-NOT transcription complex subunit 6-like isoform X2 [Mercenaria mercenaria]